jgi:protein-disulfide isomerase
MPPKKKTSLDYKQSAKPVKKDEATFTFKAKYFYAVMVVMAFAVGILIGYLAWGGAPAAPVASAVVAQPAAPQVVPTATLEQVEYSIPVEGFPSFGPEDAPITIVEFSDFQCPYCTRWHEETYRPLLEAYPGQIRFVYRNYPLGFHQNAMLSAQAALCAGDQEQYWQYHDKLFAETAVVNNPEGTTLETETYVAFAADLGLDTEAFESCLTSEKYDEAVRADVAFADSLPTQNGEPAVGGTPTFFINGTRIVGAHPLASFTQIIDAHLADLP